MYFCRNISRCINLRPHWVCIFVHRVVLKFLSHTVTLKLKMLFIMFRCYHVYHWIVYFSIMSVSIKFHNLFSSGKIKGENGCKCIHTHLLQEYIYMSAELIATEPSLPQILPYCFQKKVHVMTILIYQYHVRHRRPSFLLPNQS